MRTVQLWVLAVVVVVGAGGALLPQGRTGDEDTSFLEGSDNHRDPRLFFQFISVRPEACTTTNAANTKGTCYSPAECASLGGTSAGNCAAGLGTCCFFTRSCGGTTYGNGTTFVNPNYPSTNTDVSDCWLTVELLSDNICQLRLNFDSFELAQPNQNGKCETDFMNIIGTANDNSVPTLCGSNTGRHMYVDLDPTGGNPKIKIDTAATSSASRNWKINVDQIACDSRYRAPEGCTQYYTASSGVVESFNYKQPTKDEVESRIANIHLSNLRYGICVASRSGYCSITWSEYNLETNPYAFVMSGDAAVIEPMLIGKLDASAQGTDDCPSDYVIIPGGSFANTDGTGTLQADRYCGGGFPTQVTSNIQPFVMYVTTDGMEMLQTDVGFSLQYRQNGC